MSDSDDGWQRPKRRKTKEERLMAALKAVMRDRTPRANVCLSENMANDPEGKERAKRRCTGGRWSHPGGHECKLAKLVGRVGEKLAAPTPPPPQLLQ